MLDRLSALSVEQPALTACYLVQVPFQSSVDIVIAETMTATFAKVPAEARPFMGGSRYYPGFKDIDGVAITFYETDDFKVSEWLKQWQARIYKNGVFGLPAAYKRPIIASLYSKSQRTPTRRLTYTNAWPTDRQAFELSYSEETGRLVVQAQFSVDDVVES